MSPPPSADNAFAAGLSDVERMLYQFDQAWRSGTPPLIEAHYAPVATSSAEQRRHLLGELIKIDLEYRWRVKPSGSKPWGLEVYVQRYPEVGRLDQLSLELIGQEYEVRQCWGDRPSHQVMLARFPHGAVRLEQTLARIDAKLVAEFAEKRADPPDRFSAPTSQAPNPTITAASLMQSLQQYEILKPVQIDQLKSNAAEPRAMAKELLQRGWLTPYQVNQLLQGRGRDLLIGSYLILERLGEGGAGQVFKARHQKMDRLVALKLIRKELLADAEVVGRFSREIQVLSQLDHPNVVRAYDAGPIQESGVRSQESAGWVRGHFLAMEYIEGTDLGKLVKQGGPLPVQQACEYIRQAAAGLQHAHERGLVHRDIKPHNLIMSLRDGLIKVADLGLARLPRATNSEMTAMLTGASGTGTLTPANAVLIGTADYLAPEQALDFHQADIRADIYSLGCTFYYLLTGQPPFPGGTLAEKLMKHQQAKPPDVDKRRQDLPAGLAAVLGKMLAKRPEDRYRTPAEVVQALIPFSGSGRTAATKGQPTPNVSGRSGGRRRLLVGMAAGLTVAAVPAGLWLFAPQGGRRKDSPSPLDYLPASRDPQKPHVVADLGQRGEPAITGLAISPDCKLVAGSRENHVIDIWESSTGKKRFSLVGHKGDINRMVFSPNNQMLASISMDKTVKLWDLLKQKEARTTEVPNAGTLTFSPDGKTVAASGWDWPHLMFWSIESGEKRLTKWAELRKIQSLVYSFDSQTLVGTNFEAPPTIWNLPGEAERPLPGLPSANALALSPDGKTLVLTVRNGSIQFWDLVKGQQQKVLTKPTNLNLVMFTPDGSRLVCGYRLPTGNWRIGLLDFPFGQELWQCDCDGPPSTLASDGRHVLVNGGAVGYVYRIPKEFLGR